LRATDAVTGDVLFYLEKGSIVETETRINAPDGHPLIVTGPGERDEVTLPGNPA
jgi:hypothetical protein